MCRCLLEEAEKRMTESEYFDELEDGDDDPQPKMDATARECEERFGEQV
jgi:hypothetical protein